MRKYVVNQRREESSNTDGKNRFAGIYSTIERTDSKERKRGKIRTLYIYLHYLYSLLDFRLKIKDNGWNSND
jgi:hypothetical protein